MQVNATLESALRHFRENRLDAADKDLREILQSDPQNNSAKTLLAGIHFRRGRLAQAETLAQDVLNTEPNNVDALGMLALLSKLQHNPAQAKEYFERLLSLGQGSATLYNEIGQCCLEQRDFPAAGAAFMKAIEFDRTNGKSYYNLGLALKMAGNSLETFSTFKRAIQIDPSLQDAYIQLWQQMRHPTHLVEGIPVLESGVKRFPESVGLIVALASAYGKLGHNEDAEQLFKQAADKDSSAVQAYAHWLQEVGRFEDSVPVLESALETSCEKGPLYYGLSVAKCFEVGGERLISIVSSFLEESSVEGESRMFAHYALARSFDQDKDFESAMHNYDLANFHAYNLFNAGVKHNEESVNREQAALRKIYTRDLLNELRKYGSSSETPIFIVGMIRTGTTLLDQILASHPHIKSAGEQPFWGLVSGRINRRWYENGPSGEDLREIEAPYLEVLRTAAGSAPRITDKMPTNFFQIGLMSVAFPRAKFIHIRRNPLDTCLSIYTTFLGAGTPFAYNQENIVGYYKAYLRTMEHWRTVIGPDQLIEIDYEELVGNKEPVLRNLLDYLGLEWDDAVLNHERKSSSVSTPSLWAVRQPVNTGSVDRWRKYEPWLGKLLELKDVKHPKKIES